MAMCPRIWLNLVHEVDTTAFKTTALQFGTHRGKGYIAAYGYKSEVSELHVSRNELLATYEAEAIGVA